MVILASYTIGTPKAEEELRESQIEWPIRPRFQQVIMSAASFCDATEKKSVCVVRNSGVRKNFCCVFIEGFYSLLK